MIEKRGVIDENTPCCNGCDGNGCCGEPATKEAADALEKSVSNDLIDAVADQTQKNRE